MQLNHRHEWNVTPNDAIALQKTLVREIVSNRPIDLAAVRLIAGVDVSVKNDVSQAAVVVLSFPDFQPIETVRAQRPTPFPYIPGLLSFREGPVLVEAFEKLQHTPDVFIFDGQGIAHPRRIGIAAQMGLWLQKPTVGCGKTLLTGRYQEPDAEQGAMSDLVDRGEVIGKVVRTRANVAPVYISPGHLADIPTSAELVLRCTTKYRLPEPIRMAHNAAGKF
jgi:deoxyribonuclease V